MSKGSSGGFKGTSGGGGQALPEQISSTVMGKKIEGNVVYFKNDSVTVHDIQELNAANLSRAKKAGLEDPVDAGRVIMERKLAETAIAQGKKQRENYEHNMKTNVKGYDQLSSAISASRLEYQKQSKSIAAGERLYTAKDTGVASLTKKYPRAAAYIEAEGYANASNYIKSAFGREAMTDIRMGKPYKKAISDMKKKWTKYVNGAEI